MPEPGTPAEIKPGDRVFLPARLGPVITADPGHVASVDGDWAMVDREGWGQFGVFVTELVLAEETDA